MGIGTRIQQLRIENDLTQEQLAEMLEVSRQSVSKWEMDQAIPEVGKIIGLCQLFHVDANMLLMGIQTEKTVDTSVIEKEISRIKELAEEAMGSVDDMTDALAAAEDASYTLGEVMDLLCNIEAALDFKGKGNHADDIAIRKEPSNLERYGIEHFTDNAEERQKWFLQRAADRRKRNVDRDRRKADRERRENDRKIREAGRQSIPAFCDTVIEETIYQPVYGNIVHDINGSIFAPIKGNIEAEIDGDISCGELEGNLDGEVTGSVYVSGVAILGYFRGKIGRSVNGNIDSCFDGMIGGSLYGNILGDLNGWIGGNFSGMIDGDVNGTVEGDIVTSSRTSSAVLVLGNVNGKVGGNVFGLVDGDINGLVRGDIIGDILGCVYGSVKGSVGGNIDGDVAGLIGGDVKGDIRGDVTGIIEGDVIGNIDGNITGEIKGKVQGNVNGDITGKIAGGVEGIVSGWVQS